MLKGLLLQLRKPEQSDLKLITDWFQDPGFVENLYELEPGAHQEKVVDLLKQNAKDSTSVLTLLAETKGKDPLGLLLFQNLNWKNRTIEMNTVIGNPKYRQGLYGADLYLLGLTYAFSVLNMHQVFGYVYAGNTTAQKLSQFSAKICGILPQHYWRDGDYVDVIVYSILKQDFVKQLNRPEKSLLSKFMQTGMFGGLTL